MLPTTQKKILLAWVNLLKDFQTIISQENNDLESIQTHWQEIQNYLQSQIMSLNCDDLSDLNKSSWQTWQTETYRYVRLLNTELLFWYSAKQIKIKENRFLTIQDKLEKMIQLTNSLTI